MIAANPNAPAQAAVIGLASAACCVALVLACGGSSSSGLAGQDSGAGDSTMPETGGACVPGASIACVGPGGCSGYQACNQAGSGYAACGCGLDGASDSTLTADASADSTPLDAGNDVTDVVVPNEGPAVVSGGGPKR